MPRGRRATEKVADPGPPESAVTSGKKQKRERAGASIPSTPVKGMHSLLLFCGLEGLTRRYRKTEGLQTSGNANPAAGSDLSSKTLYSSTQGSCKMVARE